MSEEMKEIIAVVRPGKMTATKKALDLLGHPALTAYPVLGRGKQRGFMYSQDPGAISPEVLGQARTRFMDYVPKRWISVVVPASRAERVIRAIVQANRTGSCGDGRVFVCPVERAVRIRTGEQGGEALE
ncbi:MAG: P-II family nitrogen regulator [Deltaproteobacteria bacterium]|jgi:nitrogen regulatory protein PII 2|nr:P-II family nitrogen regulator [Deltaproteobacteria bacterium]